MDLGGTRVVSGGQRRERVTMYHVHCDVCYRPLELEDDAEPLWGFRAELRFGPAGPQTLEVRVPLCAEHHEAVQSHEKVSRLIVPSGPAAPLPQ